MGVSRICDAGISATFRHDGGGVVRLATGHEAKFHRVDNAT